MKKINMLTGLAVILASSVSSFAQEKNLVMNGSFENVMDNRCASSSLVWSDSITSSNHTTVDMYASDNRGSDYDVPANYMGTQNAKTGKRYAGIIAYYGDDAGIFRTVSGYRKYSEYIQFKFTEPLLAGKAYTVTYHVSLAEKSAYAVSGLGVYFSSAKTNVHNNAFLPLTPHIVCNDIITNTGWSTLTGTYIAKGGEEYLTMGCFESYMGRQKVIAENENNSRKAYYYIDDVSVTPQLLNTEDLTAILYGLCYQLNTLNFETDKSVILSESFVELKALSYFLKTYPHVVVYIDGHTDKTGTDQHNNTLSQDRANSVKTYLVNDGVDVTRLKARGHGETIPVDMDNDNSLINRRVEITICGTDGN